MKLGMEWDAFTAVPQKFVGNAETVVSLGNYSGT